MPEKISLMTFPMDIDVAMKKMTVRDILTVARENGIRYVDVMNLSGPRLREYQDASKETGVKPYCYIGSVSFFSQSEEKIRKALKEQLETAASLGAKLYMIVPVNPQKDRKICETLGKDRVQARLKRFFATAIALAENSGLRVCFETTPQDYVCLSGISDCRWILEQVPGLGLVYDTANMLPHGDDPVRYYQELKPYIVHVHAKDVLLTRPTWKDKLFHAEQTKDGAVMRCCISGQGVIPLKEILERVKQDGYMGFYALEYSHPEKYPANRIQNAARLKEHMDFWTAGKA